MEQLIEAVQKAVQIRSYSDEEGQLAQYLLELMERLGYDEAHIDDTGNVIGRVGNGQKILQFDGHMDTVRVEDGDLWQVPPFSGEIVDGSIWGRGSVDMKSALVTAIFAAAEAKKNGLLEGKTVYVTGTAPGGGNGDRKPGHGVRFLGFWHQCGNAHQPGHSLRRLRTWGIQAGAYAG